MMRRILANQNGSLSLLVALGVASVCAVMILQMSAAYNGVHKLHSDRREHSRHSLATQKLALQIKQSYLMGKIDPTCASQSGLSPEKINGTVYCLPKSGKICVQEGDERESKICLATDPALLRWDSTQGKASESPPPKSTGSGGKGQSRVQNQIVVPAPGASPLARSCQPPAACLRLVICAESVTTCTIKNAEAMQTIRLGKIQ